MSGANFRLVLSIFLVSSLNLSAVEVPNVSEFQEIHDQKKLSFEQARTAANKKHSDYATRVREKEDLQAEHTRLQAQIDRNAATMDAIEKNITDSIAQQQRLRGEIQAEEVRYKKLQAELIGLDASIRTARTRLTTQDNTVAIASQNKINVEGELRDAEEAFREASTSLADSQKWLGEVQNEQRRLARELRDLDNQLNQERTQKTGYENKNGQLEARADVLENRIERQQAEVERLVAQVDRAERTQKRAEVEVNQIQQQINTVNGEVNTAQRSVEEKRRQLRNAESAVTNAERTLVAAQAASAQVDIEKDELEARADAIQRELQRLQQEQERVDTQIGNVQEELKTAAGEKKTRLEARLANLQERAAEAQKELREKRQEMGQTRRRLLAIPAEKAEKRRAEKDAERGVETAKEQVVAVQAEITTAEATLATLRKTAVELNIDLPAATQALQTANTVLRETHAQSNAVKLALKELRDEQKENREQQREISASIRALTQSINKLENDSIPNIQRAQTRNDADIRRFTADVQKYDGQKSEKQRLVARLRPQLQNTSEILEREIRARNTISGELAGYTKRYGEAEAQSAAILVSNKKLERSIEEIATEQIAPAKVRIGQISNSNEQLRVARDTTQKNIDGAIQIELFAKASYETAEKNAGTLQGEWQTASNNLAAAQAEFNLGLARAKADGSAAGKAAGMKEALEVASVKGRQLGDGEGKFDGGLEGGKDLKQTIFDRAVEQSHALAYEQIKREKTLESAAEKEARKNQPELQGPYLSGEKVGKEKGYSDGLKAGDNSTQEAAGTAEGVRDGKAEAERLAEQTHKPMGKTDKEKEIRASQPKEKLDKDLLESEPLLSRMDSTSRSVGQYLTSVAAVVWNALVPSVRADRNKGVLRPEQVPPHTSKYPPGATNYGHPDHDGAYASAYRAAYSEFYTDKYIDVHKHTFDVAYDLAYGVAFRDASDPEKNDYPEVKAKGEAKGSLLGRYEGFGYNAAYEVARAKGLGDGEAKAFARGYNGAKEPARIAHTPTAQKNAFEAGQREVASFYSNNAVVAPVGDNAAVLSEVEDDKKYSFGDRVSLAIRLRNFGGVDTNEGDVVLRVDPRSVSGVVLESTEIALPSIEKDTEVNFLNVLVGKIAAGTFVSFSGVVLLDGKSVGDFEVKEEIFSPFSIKFTYEYDLKKGLVVPTTDGRTGAYNFVWVHGSDKAALEDLDSVQVIPVDKTLVRLSSDSTGFLKLNGLVQDVWRRPNHFALYGFRSQGLSENKMRVILKNKNGDVVFDREVAAPVTLQ